MYANSLMDEAEKVHLYMLMDELNEGGTAVWDHMFENFYGTVHVWKDNKLQTEKGLEVEEYYEFDEYVFKDTGKVRVHSLGHPEVYTLPKVLPHLEEIKIKTAFYPPKVQDLVVDFNRIGLLNTEPIKVGDVEVAPRAVLLELMKIPY